MRRISTGEAGGTRNSSCHKALDIDRLLSALLHIAERGEQGKESHHKPEGAAIDFDSRCAGKHCTGSDLQILICPNRVGRNLYVWRLPQAMGANESDEPPLGIEKHSRPR